MDRHGRNFAFAGASAIVGLVLGLYFSWIAIVASGLVAIVRRRCCRRRVLAFFVGFSTIVACLTVNQLANLAGVKLAIRGSQDR
jgi:hypothetical protein